MTSPRRHRWLHDALLAALVSALVALPACIGSPQPSPPTLSAEGVSREDGPSTDILDGVRVLGAPGAVDPAEGTVVVTPLDNEDPPVSERVRSDGSFEVVVPRVGPSDALRIQVRDGGNRSEPLDVRGNLTDGRLDPFEPIDCLVLTPRAQLDVGEVRVGERASLSVEIANDCAESLTFAAPRLREPGGPFTVLGGPTELAPGESGSVTLEVAPAAPGIAEQTLFVEATAPTPGRRPLTLFVTGAD